MEYSYIDLLCYLLIYSFLGWVVEVAVIALRDHKLKNRGFFNLPFCLPYGVAMDILIILLPTMHHYISQYVASLVVSAVVTFLGGALAKRVSSKALWHYEENNLFTGSGKPALLGLLQGAAFLLVYQLLHPVLFALVELLPDLVVAIVSLTLAGLLLVDFVTIVISLRRWKSREEMEAFQAEHQKRKRGIGLRIMGRIWRRVEGAYPDMERMERPAVFAEGVCWDKLVWVFAITALIGDLIETVFCRVTAGVWMSRSSLIYGTFSVVWGLGAVVLTVVLRRLAGKEDRYVFLAGCLIGGVYEYLCSVFTEVFLGTTFWDYSNMPFNFGGRTNLLYCVFWGLLAVVWMKGLYPRISRLVEKIPVKVGRILTWLIVAFFVLDGLVSAAAMLRYVARLSDPTVHGALDAFLDNMYPDTLVERIWPNMKIG